MSDPSKNILFIYLILVLSSCADSNGRKHNAEHPVNKLTKATHVEHTDSANIKSLLPAQIEGRYGAPISDTTFTLAQPLAEFRVSIYNHIPKQQRYANHVRIREQIFKAGNDRRLCIWYRWHNTHWTYLDSLAFAASAVF